MPQLDVISFGYFLCFGIVFGLAATVPPGPINTEIARRTLRFGLRAGFAFGLGSIVVENVLAITAGTGYGVNLDAHPTWLPVLLFVGFMVLTSIGTISLVNGYRGWQDPSLLRDPKESRGFPPARPPKATIAPASAVPVPAATSLAEAGFASDPTAPIVVDDHDAVVATPSLVGRTTLARSFWAGVGMAVISPYTIVFWIVGLPSAAHDAMQDPQTTSALLLGIGVGTTAWIAGFSALLSTLKRYTANSTWWIVWTDLIGGVMLLAFAALALLKLAQTLLHHRGPPLLHI